MNDYEHPFFRPLWRRIAVVVFCAAWAAVEFATNSPTWGMMALGFSLYSAWRFLYAYRPVEPQKDVAPDKEAED